MTLVERLREVSKNARMAPSAEEWRQHAAPTLAWCEQVPDEAADRIEELEREVRAWQEIANTEATRHHARRVALEEALRDCQTQAEEMMGYEMSVGIAKKVDRLLDVTKRQFTASAGAPAEGEAE